MNGKNFVTYEQFGAIGDGAHDDMPAIAACHEYANEHRLAVKARDGATYYIGGKRCPAVIKTNVDFGRANFIIDDREVEDIEAYCFVVASDYETRELDPASVTVADGKIDFPHEGNQFVIIESDEQKVFIRRGLNSSGGVNIRDCFIADGDGNILTDMNWSYSRLSSVLARCDDDEPITVRGGIFTTVANTYPSEYSYHMRGIQIMRSHTTVENITHFVTGEGEHGAPYEAFIAIFYANRVTVKDCLLTPRMTYKTESRSFPGKTVSMGSYDLNFDTSIELRLININQSIDIMDSRYWGIMGSNFCKDVYLENCRLSRFDAHMGVLNATVKNCTFGHMCLNLIGKGNFLLENSKVYGPKLINLRPDYGSMWDGAVDIINCEWVPRACEGAVVSSRNDGAHNFGYEAKMPYRISIKGLRIADKDEYADNATPACYFILGSYTQKYNPDAPFPYSPTKILEYSDVTADSGAYITPLKNAEQFQNVKINQEMEK